MKSNVILAKIVEFIPFLNFEHLLGRSQLSILKHTFVTKSHSEHRTIFIRRVRFCWILLLLSLQTFHMLILFWGHVKVYLYFHIFLNRDGTVVVVSPRGRYVDDLSVGQRQNHGNWWWSELMAWRKEPGHQQWYNRSWPGNGPVSVLPERFCCVYRANLSIMYMDEFLCLIDL